MSEGDENEKGQEEKEEQKLADEKEEKAEEVVSPTQPVIAPPLATAGTQPEQAARVPPLNLDDQKKEDGEPESASVGEVAEVEPAPTEPPPPLRSYEHGGPQFRNVGVELHTSSSSEGWSSSSEEEDDELPSNAGPAMLGQDIQRQDSMHMPDAAHPPPPLSSESAAKQQRTGQAGAFFEPKVGGYAQVRRAGASTSRESEELVASLNDSEFQWVSSMVIGQGGMLGMR